MRQISDGNCTVEKKSQALRPGSDQYHQANAHNRLARRLNPPSFAFLGRNYAAFLTGKFNSFFAFFTLSLSTLNGVIGAGSALRGVLLKYSSNGNKA